MSTSSRALILEAAVAALLVVGGLVLLASHDVAWLRPGLHPAWVPVLVLAARYGIRGLLAGVIAVAGAIVLAAAATGALDALSWRLATGAELSAAIAATVVAWVAMGHRDQLRMTHLALGGAVARSEAAEHAAASLQDGLARLRRRHDRVDVSITMWREVAARVERGDAADAARTLLEVAEVRLGARGGAVYLRDGNRLLLLASRGAAAAPPLDLGADRTVRTAVFARRAVPGPADATVEDSAAAAPIVDEDSGVVVGVVAVQGLAAAPGPAELLDLHLIAQWLATALSRATHSVAVAPRPWRPS